MRVADGHQVAGVDGLDVRGLQPPLHAVLGRHLHQPPAGVAARGDRAELQRGVAVNERRELGAGEAGRAEDVDPGHPTQPSAGRLERLADAGDGRLDLVVGQRPPGVGELQAQRQAHVPLPHLLAGVAVEHAHAAHQRRAGRARGRHQVGRAGRLGYDHRDVAGGDRHGEEVP